MADTVVDSLPKTNGCLEADAIESMPISDCKLSTENNTELPPKTVAIEGDVAVSELTNELSNLKKSEKPAADIKSNEYVKVLKENQVIQEPAVDSSGTSVDPISSSDQSALTHKRTRTSPKHEATPRRESKRIRVSASPYQYNPDTSTGRFSPSTPKSVKKTSNLDPMFFKMEYLAVRNSDDGFFVCQAVNNIHPGTKTAKIRWMGEVESSIQSSSCNAVYVHEFYDKIRFETILTSVKLISVAKSSGKRFSLSSSEVHRIKGILQRSVQNDETEASSADVSKDQPKDLGTPPPHGEAQLPDTDEKLMEVDSSAARKSDDIEKKVEDTEANPLDSHQTAPPNSDVVEASSTAEVKDTMADDLAPSSTSTSHNIECL